MGSRIRSSRGVIGPPTQPATATGRNMKGGGSIRINGTLEEGRGRLTLMDAGIGGRSAMGRSGSTRGDRGLRPTASILHREAHCELILVLLAVIDVLQYI